MNYLLLLFPVLMAGALLAAMPRLYRPNYVFGNTVPAGFRDSDEARSALHEYQRDVILWSLLAAALLIAWPGTVLVHATAVPVVQGGGVLWSWLRQRRRLRMYAVAPQSIREAGITAVAESMYGGWIVWIAPFALLGFATWYVQQNAGLLPDRIPTHYGLNGPDAWGPRNWRTLYAPLLIGAVVMSSLFTTALGLSFGSRRGGTPEQDAFRRANLRLLLGIHWSIGFLFTVLGTAPVRNVIGPEIPAWLPLAPLLIVFVVFGWQVFQANRLSPGPDPTPDECWHAGDFYYNPADPAFIVEKRFGIGYTFNLAHKAVWAFLAQIVLLVALAIFLARG